MFDIGTWGKLKLILRLRKGNALDLEENEFISLEDAGQTFDRLTEARAVHDWRPALRMTAWTSDTEGHMILIEVTTRSGSPWSMYLAGLTPQGGSLGLPGGSTRSSRASRLRCASVTAPPTHPVDVLLLLTDADQVLLALRAGTGYADGQWNLPSGKLEPDEDAISAVIREAREEIGLRLSPDEPQLVATVHHRNPSGHARVGLVFAVTHDPRQHGEPVNAEPHKCARIEWFPTTLLPSNTYPYTTACVQAFSDGRPLALDGWR